MNFSVIIPARYASTRLPGKLLLDIAGKPMIQHVYERALKSGASQVIVATDDERIYRLIETIGGQACMTHKEHTSGTERIAQAVDILAIDNDEIIVNIQGDEPLIEPKLIAQSAHTLANNANASITTLCEPIHDIDDIFDPHQVKVVLDHEQYALYFSRAAIAWQQHGFDQNPKKVIHEIDYYRHIGLYSYRAGFIKQYTSWLKPALECVEALEQLRALYYGAKIKLDIVEGYSCLGVDTQEDLNRVRALMKGHF